jgi:hypothetical protein
VTFLLVVTAPRDFERPFIGVVVLVIRFSRVNMLFFWRFELPTDQVEWLLGGNLGQPGLQWYGIRCFASLDKLMLSSVF